jgi:hypothetical protein
LPKRPERSRIQICENFNEEIFKNPAVHSKGDNNIKLNTFMTIASIVAFIFGLAFLLAPVLVMSMYGVALDISGQYIGRYLGSAFLGIAAIGWFARNAKEDEAKRAILLGGFVVTLTGFVASLFDKFYGLGNALVWSTVVIYLLLAIGFGYFYFGKPK